MRALFLVVVSVGIAACHPRPVEELTLADVAVRAAARSKADALVPTLFRKAENYYLRAKRDFRDGYYDACRKHADEARRLAEKAEYESQRKKLRMKDGEGESGSNFQDSEGANVR